MWPYNDSGKMILKDQVSVKDKITSITTKIQYLPNVKNAFHVDVVRDLSNMYSRVASVRRHSNIIKRR